MNAVVGVPRAAIATGPASRSSFPSSRTDAATVVPPLPPPRPPRTPPPPPTPQPALNRSLSLKAGADSKINTDEVLKTIADKVRDARSRARPAGPPSPPLPSRVRAPRQVFFVRPVDRFSIPRPPLAPDPSPSPAFAAPARPDPPARSGRTPRTSPRSSPTSPAPRRSSGSPARSSAPSTPSPSTPRRWSSSASATRFVYPRPLRDPARSRGAVHAQERVSASSKRPDV